MGKSKLSAGLLAEMLDFQQALTIKPEYTKRFVRQLRIKVSLEKVMTYTELADRLGMTQPWLSNVANGKAGASLQTQLRICEELGLDPEVVYRGERDGTDRKASSARAGRVSGG